MKKIILTILLIIVAIGGFFGYKYCEKTYASHVAYAQIPDTIPAKEQTKDSRGKIVDNMFSYTYELTFVDQKGNTQKLSYEMSSENPKPFEPNSFVKADISATRVTNGPTSVSKAALPKIVAEKLADQ